MAVYGVDRLLRKRGILLSGKRNQPLQKPRQKMEKWSFACSWWWCMAHQLFLLAIKNISLEGLFGSKSEHLCYDNTPGLAFSWGKQKVAVSPLLPTQLTPILFSWPHNDMVYFLKKAKMSVAPHKNTRKHKASIQFSIKLLVEEFLVVTCAVVVHWSCSSINHQTPIHNLL